MRYVKENKKRDITVTLVLIAAVLFTGFMSVFSNVSGITAKRDYAALRDEVLTEVPRTSPVITTVQTDPGNSANQAEPEEVPYYPSLAVDFSRLYEINELCMGWLYIPALDISYPIAKAQDNDFYLNHNFEGEPNTVGAIFADYASEPYLRDRNTFIFGHNTRDGSMFGSFKNVLKGKTSIETDPYIYIYQSDGVHIFQIFAAYETTKDSDRYMNFRSDEAYDEYVGWALEHSVIDFDCDMSGRGNIVSLSTCYGKSGTTHRALIHGVKVAFVSY